MTWNKSLLLLLPIFLFFPQGGWGQEDHSQHQDWTYILGRDAFSDSVSVEGIVSKSVQSRSFRRVRLRVYVLCQDESPRVWLNFLWPDFYGGLADNPNGPGVLRVRARWDKEDPVELRLDGLEYEIGSLFTAFVSDVPGFIAQAKAKNLVVFRALDTEHESSWSDSPTGGWEEVKISLLGFSRAWSRMSCNQHGR